MNEYFVSRNACPCCCYPASEGELCRAAYVESPLRDYIESFYSSQGRVDFKYLRGQDYVLVECSNCSLVYQREIPNDFLMHKIYDEWIDPQKSLSYSENKRGYQYSSRCNFEISQVLRLFDRSPEELRFLDFSMGWGQWCQIAQSFGCTVHGTEFSKPRIDHARSKGVNVIEYDEIANHRYDFINTEQVFEHLPEPRITLSYLRQSLSPGGVIKISVPDGWDVKERLVKWDWAAPKGSTNSLNAVAPLEHISCFNHAALLTLGQAFGLTPVDINWKNGLRKGALTEAVKAVVRPYWYIIRGIRRPARGGTSLLLKARPTSDSSTSTSSLR